MKMRFQVLTAASVNMVAFWDMAPCSVEEVHRRFRRAYCVHHHSNNPDDGGSKHLWIVSLLLRDYKVSYPRALPFS
jgi:hypothetical protein